MLFSVIVSVIVVVFCLVMDNMVSGIAGEMTLVFGTVIVGQQHIFINAENDKLSEMCPVLKDQFVSLENIIAYFYVVVLITGIGYFTSIIQKLTIFKLKDNVSLSAGRLFLEGSIVVTSVIFLIMEIRNPSNPLITDICSKVM